MPYSRATPLDKGSAILNPRYLTAGGMAFAATAGYVNSVALGFFHSPVSHMTGTVSYLGIDLVAEHVRDSLTSLSILVGFVVGAILGGLIVGAEKLLPGRRHASALFLESAMLAGAAVLLLTRHALGIPAVSMACGLQNATTSSYCGLMIRTTHVTGTVTDIGVMIGHWIRHRKIDRWKLGFMLTLVFSFGCGVAIGAIANSAWGPAGLFLPACGTAVGALALWIAAGRGWLGSSADYPAEPRSPARSAFSDSP